MGNIYSSIEYNILSDGVHNMIWEHRHEKWLFLAWPISRPYSNNDRIIDNTDGVGHPAHSIRRGKLFLSLQSQCNLLGCEAKVAKGRVATCETVLSLLEENHFLNIDPI